MTAADHATAWEDEYRERPWPAHPSAVYLLARSRAHEARQTGQMVRAILRFIDVRKVKCS